MNNLVAVLIVLAVVGAAVGYIVKAKKSGAKCIGCPDSHSCSAKGRGDGCGCCGHSE